MLADSGMLLGKYWAHCMYDILAPQIASFGPGALALFHPPFIFDPRIGLLLYHQAAAFQDAFSHARAVVELRVGWVCDGISPLVADGAEDDLDGDAAVDRHSGILVIHLNLLYLFRTQRFSQQARLLVVPENWSLILSVFF